MKNYIKNSLITDVLVQIPLFMSYDIDRHSTYDSYLSLFILECLIFLKYFNLKQVFQRLVFKIQEFEGMSKWIPLIELVFIVTIVGHIVALLWHVLAVIETEIYGYDNTWLHINNYENLEVWQFFFFRIFYKWYAKYLFSYYWAVSTMVTILLYIP